MSTGSATPSPTHSDSPHSLPPPTPPSSNQRPPPSAETSSASSPPQQLLQRHPSLPTAAAASTENVAGSSYFTFPVTYSVNGLLRRLSGDSAPMPPSSQRGRDEGLPPLPGHLRYPDGHEDKRGGGKDQHGNGRRTPPPPSAASSYLSRSLTSSLSWGSAGGGAGSWSAANTGATSLSSSAHALAHKRDVERPESPFQPPPLAPLQLAGHAAGTREGAKVLGVTLAEEIRLLVPARLQLEEEWRLAFSLERDGVSLATLYQKCAAVPARRGGFVLVVRDGGGGVRHGFGSFESSKRRLTRATGLRRVPVGRAAPVGALLRHGRVLSLARDGAAGDPGPVGAAAAAERGHDARAAHDDAGHDARGAHPLQGLPVQRRQRLHDALRDAVPERRRWVSLRRKTGGVLTWAAATGITGCGSTTVWSGACRRRARRLGTSR